MTQTSANRLTKFKELVDQVFKTDNGKALLEFLKEEYAGHSVVRETPEQTYYCLGQKELIELLENVLKDESMLKETEVQSEYNTDY